MTDDSDLAGLDPYDLMETEAGRLDGFFTGLDDAAWDAPSQCDGWSLRDVLAHLAATEDYTRACVEGTVSSFLAEGAKRGATDVASFNELGVRSWRGTPPAEILAVWRTKAAENRRDFRGRDGGNVDTSVGDYPARLQAFHLAFELAVHAYDVGVPVSEDEAEERLRWLSCFGRFAIKENHPDAQVELHDGAVRVRDDGGGAIDVTLAEAEFVCAVAAREVPAALDAPSAAYLSAV